MTRIADLLDSRETLSHSWRSKQAILDKFGLGQIPRGSKFRLESDRVFRYRERSKAHTVLRRDGYRNDNKKNQQHQGRRIPFHDTPFS
jgi:hypothetical protein